MTSKQRVLASLRREPADRVPIFMWFHPETARTLSRILGIPAERVAEAMGDDVRQTWVGNNTAMEGITHDREGETHVDDWGIVWEKIGPFNQIRRSPLQHASEEDILRYRYPHGSIDRLLSQMEPVVRSAGASFVGCDVSPCLFEMICRLRGMEDAVLDLAGEPFLAAHLLAGAADFGVALAQGACDRYALDWLWTGDDVAGQQGMIMSPLCWREMVRPHLARIVAVGKSRGLPVAYHCCGAVRPIIPDLIEIGVDVLNPIQCNCPGMDPVGLKKEFGNRLAFMGGVDTVDLLPNGSPQLVRRETATLIERMTDGGGGYILAASHTVPPETPPDNVFAMYEAADVTREEIFDRAADIRSH